MQNIYKKFLPFALSLSFIFCAQYTFAQYPGMGAVYNNMNTQFMTQQMNMMMGLNMARGFATNNIKHDFTVTMKDSATKKITSKIYTDTTIHKDYLLLVDKSFPKSNPKREQKIYANQTIKISRDDYDPPFDGMANDSCWMFKVMDGPISAYSYLSETEDFETSIIGIQTNNGPIKALNKDNLKQIISADNEAMALFNKKKYFAALKKYNKDFLKMEKK
jgi:hypothetical protein